MRPAPFCRLSLTLLAVLALAGCSGLRSMMSPSEPAAAPVVPAAQPAAPAPQANMPPVVLPSRLTVTGYGALPTQEGLSLEQRRLLAIRAAKLDAYRSLAETVAGLKITGNSTVSALAMNNDSFRVYVEAHLRGARVLTVTPLPGGSYETVLELQLGGEFYRDAVVAAQGQPVAPSVVPAPTAAAAESSKPVVKPLAEAASAPSASNNFYLAQ